MRELFFATAGIPISTVQSNTLNGIRRVRELNLGAMELEFVRSINISDEFAPKVKECANQNNIVLTCHAPYYINLNAQDPAKRNASMQRIEKSADVLYKCGGWSVCYHPGYYLDMEKTQVFENVLARIKEISKKLDEQNIDLWIRPETTGKPSQFGNLHELLEISQQVNKVMPVIDFSHLHARTGQNNTKSEFRAILTDVEKFLGKEGLENMHIHVSGIAYSEKGEKNHLNLKESDLNYQDLVNVWKEFNIKGVVVSESPNIEEDALLLQSLFR